MFRARTFRTLLEASRPAMPLGSAGRSGGKDGQVTVPAGRQLAPLHQIDLVRQLGVLRPVRSEEIGPAASSLRAARPDAGGEVLHDTVGDEELRVFRPAVEAFAQLDLVVAEGLAVRRRGVLLVRGAVADVAVEDDEGGAVGRLL